MASTYNTLLAQTRTESTTTLRISLNAVDARRKAGTREERNALAAICSAIIEVLVEREPELATAIDDWADDLGDDRSCARLVLDWFQYTEAVTA
jgi:hypothetical protein